MVSREEYEDLYNNAPVPYFSVGIDGIIKRCNYKTEEMTEYSAGELIGMNAIDLYFDAPDGKEKATRLLRQFKSGQPIINEELRMKKKSGEPYWINLTVNIIKDKNGNVIESRSVVEDITEGKKNEDELRSANANLLNILESMEDGVYIVNQEYDIEFTNSVLKKEFGPPEGKKCYEYFHNRQDVCPWCKNQDVFAGKTVHWEWYSPRNQKTYDLIDTPITNADGSISKLEIFRDITERKSVENHREQALERQQKLNRLQEVLLGPGNLEEKLKQITEAVVETFAADFCRVWIIKPGDLCESGCIHGSSGGKEIPDDCKNRNDCLHLVASAGRYTRIDGDHRRVPIGSYKIGRIAFGREKKFLTSDVANDPLGHNPEWAKKIGLVSFAGYQLHDSTEKPIGILALFAKHPISPEESSNLEGLANITAQVIQTEGAKEDLRKSEEKMGSILRTVGEGIIAVDQDSTIIFINWEICSIFGYWEKELIGRNLQMLMPENYRDKHAAGLKRYLKDDQPKILGQRLEMKGLRKNGSIFPLEIEIEETQRDKSGNRIFTAAIRDITNRKKAEKEMSRLSMAIEQTAETVLITDTGGDIIYANPAFAQITGYSSEEVIGKNPKILKSGKQDDAFYRKMWETITQGDAWHGHFINKKKDGALYEVDAIISPVFDSSGKIFNYVGISRDVTSEVRSQKTIAKQVVELKQYSNVLLSILEDMEETNKNILSANKELKEKQAQLVQASKLASIGELAAGVAHELNQPLMVIRGFTQMMLKEEDRYDEKTLKHLDAFELSTSKMMTIINHLRTFSRKQEKNPVMLNLHTPIDNAFVFVNEQLKKNNIIVEKKYQPDLPFIKGDGHQLEQVIMNLISNAIFAIDEFEKKRSAGNGKEDGKWKKIISIKTGYEREKNQVWIEFADTGGGIPEDHLYKVFDPFFTSKEVGKGTGLGLSICYGIIKEHDGEIEVFNNKAGAVFKISLPCTTKS